MNPDRETQERKKNPLLKKSTPTLLSTPLTSFSFQLDHFIYKYDTILIVTAIYVRVKKNLSTLRKPKTIRADESLQ